MKKFIKIFQILLILAIFLFGIINFDYTYATDEVASGTCGDNIKWALDNSGKLTITGNGKMSGSSCAWEDYKDLVKKVEFSGNITSISACAFELNTNLESVTLPDAVTSVGRRAFAECTNLKTVIFPRGLRDIGASAFYKCTSLESADLGDELLYIRDNAFTDCTSLKSITTRSSLVSVTDTKDEYDTISNTVHIYGYKYNGIYYYARHRGMAFTDLTTDTTITGTITNQDYLDALPKQNIENLGISSNDGVSTSSDGSLNEYATSFCDEKDETNETYQKIKSKVEEITADCTTEKEKAYAIMRWAYINIDYVSALGARATIEQVYSVYNRMRGSCEAYTILTNYMLYLCDIPTATVKNFGHEWTAAYVDGEWIYLDSTQNRFETTPNEVSQIILAYDGLLYIIDDPTEGAKVAGIAKTDDELENLTSFTIPTNSYMNKIYPRAFDEDIELKAEIGTVGAEYIENNRLYHYTEGNYIIGSNTEIIKYLKGDINNDGQLTVADLNYGLRKLGTGGITEEEIKRGDVTGEGEYTVADLNRLLRYLGGVLEEL